MRKRELKPKTISEIRWIFYDLLDVVLYWSISNTTHKQEFYFCFCLQLKKTLFSILAFQLTDMNKNLKKNSILYCSSIWQQNPISIQSNHNQRNRYESRYAICHKWISILCSLNYYYLFLSLNWWRIWKRKWFTSVHCSLFTIHYP